MYEESRLANGLTVHYLHFPHAIDISLSLLVPSGCRHDPPDQPGMAHFIEHLLWNNIVGSNDIDTRIAF